MKLRTLFTGGAIGAAIAYLLDPVSGRGRRTRLRDRAASELRRTRERTDAKRRHLSNLARGTMSEIASPGPDDVAPDDATLAQRIQSEVFGSPEIPKDRIALTVVDGIAELRGELDSPEDINVVFVRVSAVPGVRGVRNLMRTHGSEAPNKQDALRASDEAERRAS